MTVEYKHEPFEKHAVKINSNVNIIKGKIDRKSYLKIPFVCFTVSSLLNFLNKN